MPKIWVTCSYCGKSFYMWPGENVACPNCNRVVKSTSGSKIYVTCNECGKGFYMWSTESTNCPYCGKLVIGPEA